MTEYLVGSLLAIASLVIGFVLGSLNHSQPIIDRFIEARSVKAEAKKQSKPMVVTKPSNEIMNRRRGLDKEVETAMTNTFDDIVK